MLQCVGTSGVSDDHAGTVPPRLGGIEKELLDLMMVEDGSGLSRLLIRFLDVGGQTSGTSKSATASPIRIIRCICTALRAR